jgi:hypothetical protein
VPLFDFGPNRLKDIIQVRHLLYPSLPHQRLGRNSTNLSFRASPIPYQIRGRLVGRDPESSNMAKNQIILDPSSHPASVFAKASPDRPRDLAGMTKYETASQGREALVIGSGFTSVSIKEVSVLQNSSPVA